MVTAGSVSGDEAMTEGLALSTASYRVAAALQRRAKRGEAEIGDRDLQRQVRAVRNFTLEGIVADRRIEAQAEQVNVFRVLEHDAWIVELGRIVQRRVRVTTGDQQAVERRQRGRQVGEVQGAGVVGDGERIGEKLVFVKSRGTFSQFQ